VVASDGNDLLAGAWLTAGIIVSVWLAATPIRSTLGTSQEKEPANAAGVVTADVSQAKVPAELRSPQRNDRLTPFLRTPFDLLQAQQLLC
jgi:hypothetical protein